MKPRALAILSGSAAVAALAGLMLFHRHAEGGVAEAEAEASNRVKAARQRPVAERETGEALRRKWEEESAMQRWLEVIRRGDEDTLTEFLTSLPGLELSLAQYHELLAAVMESNTGDARRFETLMTSLLHSMGQHFPAEALATLEELLPRLVEMPNAPALVQRQLLISSTLRGQPQPDIAAAWLLQNFEQFTGGTEGENFRTATFLQRTFEGWSNTDPGRAVSLLDKFPVEFRDKMLEGIGNGTPSPDRFAEVVAAVRQLPDAEPDELPAAFLKGLGMAMEPGTAEHPAFDKWTAAIDAAGLTPQETQSVVSGLPTGAFSEETPAWIGWILEHSDPEHADAKIQEYESRWGLIDLSPAQQWAEEPPDSPAKQATRRALGETAVK